jgi:hypothetical protein
MPRLEPRGGFDVEPGDREKPDGHRDENQIFHAVG